MPSRKSLIPKDVRELAEELGLRGPMYYVGTLNGEPNGYREVKLPPKTAVDRRREAGATDPASSETPSES